MTRTVNCPECGGSGIRAGEIICFDCNGEGQWDAEDEEGTLSLEECRERFPLKGLGECPSGTALSSLRDQAAPRLVPSGFNRLSRKRKMA